MHLSRDSQKMENCKHLSHIKKWNHSILNPQKWLCYECGTTESVWACLSCPSVACGRFNEEHALKHYKESQHPLCIEVNEKYVYCYKCDDYVLNDNAAGDLKILRSALSAIVTQSFKDVESRGRRLLRSYSHTAIVSPSKSDEDDRIATADFHWRQSVLGKLFAAWRMYVQEIKIKQQEQTPDKKHTAMTPSSSSPFNKRRTLIPGLTGLRNLGNTCYMNSVLQILSHMEDFRDFFMKSIDPKPSQLTTPESSPKASVLVTCTSRLSSVISSIMSFNSPPSSSKTSSSSSENSPTTASTRYLSRQDTNECFKHLMTPTKDLGSSRRRHHSGLSGGSMSGTPVKRSLICNVEERDSPSYKVSLCEELNGLFRVLWSGRWAQVSPHAFLQAVWYSIPMFKGHAQHDAQEFLSELLDKVQSELATINGSLPNAENIITETFQGQLVSQVTCLECMNISETREAFMDLSLEFPNRYQITLNHSKVSQEACHVTEMLHTFTEIEKLEGKIYSCENCNANRENHKSPIKPKYTEAQKQFIVKSLPRVLRLHLKRFRWSGRLHREKINTPVVFDDVLDMKPFCDQTEQNDDQYKYNLQGVVIHHGRGFGSGHYTAYCWNSVAESWIECNDSKIKLCSLEDVLQSQGYILVYTKSSDSDNLATPLSYTEDSSDGSDSEVPKLKTSSSQIIDDEITFNFKTPTTSDVAHGNRKRTSSGSENGDKRIIKRRRSTLW